MKASIPTPLQVRGEVISLKRVGDYFQLSIAAPGIAERMKPGQFVALAVGGQRSSMLLRRAFSIYTADPRGVFGGTVEIVFAVQGGGTKWLSQLQAHSPVDVVGPLGTPFPIPAVPVKALLVGGGYGAAPLFSLADLLRTRGCRVEMILGAATGARLFGVVEGRRAASQLILVTEDASLGLSGKVTDHLDAVVERSGTELIYACGPMGMLKAISFYAKTKGIPAQCLVEEEMACGIGVCMTCVLPIRGEDGLTRMTRACVSGPSFDGESVLWDSIGTIPAGTYGSEASS
ncbi:MAG TPA: dihydroorotate dehydrogenase electron transfer subunit [Candidatus Nanopelagicaceae bacterium]|nr:dihydroorotate dehydrogenase electron transfer subunit [Candidatus Nanopelagicaceae bacterium]